MKTRAGFISNSSSTSYVVICKKDVMEDVIKPLFSEIEKEWIDASFYTKNMFDIETKVLEYTSGNYDTLRESSETETLKDKMFNQTDDEDFDFGDYFYDFVSRLKSEITKNKGVTFSVDS